MKVLEVLHLATYESFGGAARASKRIYQALKTWPILCHMFTLLKTSEDESIFVVQPKDPHEQLKYIHALLTSNQKQKLGKNVILESYGEISGGIVDKINPHQTSISHLHWILKEEGLAKKLASAGRKNVIKKNSSEMVSKQYYNLYQKVLTNN